MLTLSRRFTPWFWLLLLTLGGCASMPKEQHLAPSFAQPQSHPGELGRILAPTKAEHPEQSGLGLISRADDALKVRLAMADLAEHTLDLQYYIWHGDSSGLLLLERVARAAERGVRVRLLLDDHTFTGSDKELKRIASLPNLEIKLYNPYGKRRSGSFARTLAFLGEFGRLNHRMHNKMMVADNQLAVVGGRNIGDEYFGLSDGLNFRDLDLFAAGPVVNDLSASFDQYWNSSWAISINSIHGRKVTPGTFEELFRVLEAERQAQPPLPYQIEFNDEELRRAIEQMPASLTWGRALVTADPPRKDLAKALPEDAVASILGQLGAGAEEEILVAAPYFVPGDLMIQGLAQLHQAGVRVRVLTNSLHANDVKVAHYGYVNRRQETLETGTELYELRPDAASALATQPSSQSQVPVGLHAKVAVYDRKRVYIGSANLDPRSHLLNTEIGLVVDDPELAQAVAALLLADMAPDSAYRVTLDEEGDPCWHWEEAGTPWRACTEPGIGTWDRLGIWVNWLLPIEDQL
ncbi:phospholipase D family protein [Ferrimonas balearica]|uniref:phospholipase D family protein n=1 Tax=Ferrimonas balearica TaxID=44012 RepID=UPI001C99B466|nr:phospholipase D family protein [Ferrimonas balearica]MBY5992629.1 phospholipase D family protein [Ferrimonas balearica]